MLDCMRNVLANATGDADLYASVGGAEERAGTAGRAGS